MSTVWMAPPKGPAAEAAAPPAESMASAEPMEPAQASDPVESSDSQEAEPETVEFQDRLDRIHGIGAGFLRQLHDVGITSLVQIAELDLDDLLDEEHPLHALHARIEAGGWVEQAQALLAGKPH